MLDAEASNKEKVLYLKFLASKQLTSNSYTCVKHSSISLWTTNILPAILQCSPRPYLLVATGGFDRCSGNTVYMKARNKKADYKEWNPKKVPSTKTTDLTVLHIY
jgi:hypothetical protein